MYVSELFFGKIEKKIYKSFIYSVGNDSKRCLTYEM